MRSAPSREAETGGRRGEERFRGAAEGAGGGADGMAGNVSWVGAVRMGCRSLTWWLGRQCRSSNQDGEHCGSRSQGSGAAVWEGGRPGSAALSLNWPGTRERQLGIGVWVELKEAASSARVCLVCVCPGKGIREPCCIFAGAVEGGDATR